MQTPTTHFEIRDRHGNWHPLNSAFFWSPSKGQRVLMYFIEGSDRGYERSALDRLISSGDVREAGEPSDRRREPAFLPTDEARRVINTSGREHTLVVRFTKADGSPRRMVCRYAGTPARSRYHMTVWDMEKGGWRKINTRTCTEIKVISFHQKAA